MPTDDKISALTAYTPPIDTDVLPVVDVTTSATKKVTWANIKATLKSYFDGLYSVIGLTKYSNLNAPAGFLINGRIVRSVANNDLTVAIKGMDGNDPSATNPVYIRIGDTLRSITAALSITLADGTNYFNAGATLLATIAIDYFVYLGYNATDGVVLGFARIPFATTYGEFSTTNTNEKYCAISTITNAAAGDDYVVIGRFEAMLSGTANFYWSVNAPTTTNLIQRPIYNTRWLSYTPVVYGAGGSAGAYAASNQVGRYMFNNKTMSVRTVFNHSNLGSWTGQLKHQLPFGLSSAEASAVQPVLFMTIWSNGALTMESGTYSISAAGVVSGVSSINATLYDYGGLITTDWITIAGQLEMA